MGYVLVNDIGFGVAMLVLSCCIYALGVHRGRRYSDTLMDVYRSELEEAAARTVALAGRCDFLQAHNERLEARNRGYQAELVKYAHLSPDNIAKFTPCPPAFIMRKDQLPPGMIGRINQSDADHPAAKTLVSEQMLKAVAPKEPE